MKLSVKKRLQIVAMATKKHEEYYKTLYRKITGYNAEIDVLSQVGTKAERTRMSKLPEGWMREEQYLTMNHPNISLVEMSIGLNGQVTKKHVQAPSFERVDLEDPIRVKKSLSRYSVPYTDNVKKMYLELESAHKYWQTLKVDIFNALKNFSTTDELVKEWPEMKPYVKELDDPQTVTTLVVPIKSINERLKGTV